MIRRSVVGPLILILLGAAFLANNIVPDFRISSLFTTYWPFLLIAWGVLRLGEILYLAISARPLPRRGLSGNETLLVILICVFGSIAATASRHLPNFHFGPRGVDLFGESFDYPMEARKTLPPKSKISFHNLRGNIRVTGGDAKEIVISGHKTIRAFDRDGAAKTDKETPLEVEVSGDHVTVKTNQEKTSGADNRQLSVDLEVTVPKDSSIEGRGRYGDFDITGIDGSVEIVSDNAGVRLNNIGGNARVELRRSDIVRAVDVKGNVEVTGTGSGGDVELENVQGTATVSGSFGGNLDFKNVAKNLRFTSRNTEFTAGKVPGQVSMNLGNLTATNLAGPVRITSKSRDIRLEQFTDALEVEVERGDVELRPKTGVTPKITVRCKNSGNIELVLPPPAKFDLVASTERGEITNDWGDALKTEQDGRSASLKGKVGAGPAIALNTSRGSVTVRKGE